jgi:glucans biosynthesis protein
MLLVGLAASVCVVGAACDSRSDTAPSNATEVTASPLLASTETPVEALESVAEVARMRAGQPYDYAAEPLPPSFASMDYDLYRRLRPRAEAAMWRDTANSNFALLPLPRGYIFGDRIRVSVIDNGVVDPITNEGEFFDFQDVPTAPAADRTTLGASGWRALYPFREKKPVDEALVFQGGAYFRALARNLTYGISARALAIGTASPEGEEFPRFTDFWIFRPHGKALTFVALMDTPSATGAYLFDLRPGTATHMDVTARIFPRRTITTAGLAAMSSMYQHGSADRAGVEDPRPEVHDSDGLSILTAAGEHIWRPVSNPKRLEVSAFSADNVKGFGLLQRRRDAESYADLEAKYEQRPSLWVEPVGDWGEGLVSLVEIPTPNEYNDNIAAYWRPAQAWEPGQEQTFTYRLTWDGPGPLIKDVGTVTSTRIGNAPGSDVLKRVLIDFTGDKTFAAAQAPQLDLWASSGEIRDAQIIPKPGQGFQIKFDLDPQGAEVIELHAALKAADRQITETWLFRWTQQ